MNTALKPPGAAETGAFVKIGLCEEKERWNAAVEGFGGSLYQSWEWGAARSNSGWIPWRVLVEQDGQPVAAMQVLERRLPGIGAGLMYAPRPMPPDGRNQACWAALVDWLRGFMRERRSVVLRADPPVLDSDADGIRVLEDLGFHQRREQQWSAWGNLPRAWMIINIEGSEEEILGRMRKTHRYLIRKLPGNELEVLSGCNSGLIQDLYSLLRKTASRREFPMLGQRYFDNLMETVFSPDLGQIFIARFNGLPVAGVGCSRFGRTSYYLYGGFDFAYHHLNLNQLLHWRAIQWAKAHGCCGYNMIGAGTRYPPAEGNGGFNLYNFKLGFGAELQYYAGYFDLYNTPLSYKLFDMAEQRFGGRLYRLAKSLTRGGVRPDR